MTDAEAILASGTDPARFAAVFERQFATVHRYLGRRVGKDLADDLAAETFVRAFDGRHRYNPGQPSALPWLMGIAHNLLRRHHRTERRRLAAYARSGADPGAGPDLDRADDRCDAAAAGPAMARALAELSGRERDVLLLHAWADLSYQEIAAVLGIPTGTVRSRLSRARTRLRERLGGIGQYPVAGATPIDAKEGIR